MTPRVNHIILMVLAVGAAVLTEFSQINHSQWVILGLSLVTNLKQVLGQSDATNKGL